MNKQTFILTILFAIVTVAISVSFFVLNKKLNNIVVVDVIKTLNEFKMKKELEAKVEVKLSEYTNKLDSLKGIITQMERSQIRNESYGNMVALYQNAQVEFQNAYEISNKNINEQVWKRLNPLIDKFAKQNNFRIMIGANGMGTVLYNADVVDKTTDLINFINGSYEKGN